MSHVHSWKYHISQRNIMCWLCYFTFSTIRSGSSVNSTRSTCIGERVGQFFKQLDKTMSAWRNHFGERQPSILFVFIFGSWNRRGEYGREKCEEKRRKTSEDITGNKSKYDFVKLLFQAKQCLLGCSVKYMLIVGYTQRIWKQVS